MVLFMAKMKHFWFIDAGPAIGYREYVYENKSDALNHMKDRNDQVYSVEAEEISNDRCVVNDEVYRIHRLKNEKELIAITKEIENELVSACEAFLWWPEDPCRAAAIVNEESGELVRETLQACYETDGEDIDRKLEAVKKEAIQTAAMAMRFLLGLQLNVYRFDKGKQIQGVTVCSSDSFGKGPKKWTLK